MPVNGLHHRIFPTLPTRVILVRISTGVHQPRHISDRFKAKHADQSHLESAASDIIVILSLTTAS